MLSQWEIAMASSTAALLISMGRFAQAAIFCGLSFFVVIGGED